MKGIYIILLLLVSKTFAEDFVNKVYFYPSVGIQYRQARISLNNKVQFLIDAEKATLQHMTETVFCSKSENVVGEMCFWTRRKHTFKVFGKKTKINDDYSTLASSTSSSSIKGPEVVVFENIQDARAFSCSAAPPTLLKLCLRKLNERVEQGSSNIPPTSSQLGNLPPEIVLQIFFKDNSDSVLLGEVSEIKENSWMSVGPEAIFSQRLSIKHNSGPIIAMAPYKLVFPPGIPYKWSLETLLPRRIAFNQNEANQPNRFDVVVADMLYCIDMGTNSAATAFSNSYQNAKPGIQSLNINVKRGSPLNQVSVGIFNCDLKTGSSIMVRSDYSTNPLAQGHLPTARDFFPGVVSPLDVFLFGPNDPKAKNLNVLFYDLNNAFPIASISFIKESSEFRGTCRLTCYKYTENVNPQSFSNLNKTRRLPSTNTGNQHHDNGYIDDIVRIDRKHLIRKTCSPQGSISSSSSYVVDGSWVPNGHMRYTMLQCSEEKCFVAVTSPQLIPEEIVAACDYNSERGIMTSGYVYNGVLSTRRSTNVVADKIESELKLTNGRRAIKTGYFDLVLPGDKLELEFKFIPEPNVKLVFISTNNGFVSIKKYSKIYTNNQDQLSSSSKGCEEVVVDCLLGTSYTQCWGDLINNPATERGLGGGLPGRHDVISKNFEFTYDNLIFLRISILWENMLPQFQFAEYILSNLKNDDNAETSFTQYTLKSVRIVVKEKHTLSSN